LGFSAIGLMDGGGRKLEIIYLLESVLVVY
jgi:hypothetical protein